MPYFFEVVCLPWGNKYLFSGFKVQSKVNMKYDTWHKEILSKFASRLGDNMQDFYGSVSKVILHFLFSSCCSIPGFNTIFVVISMIIYFLTLSLFIMTTSQLVALETYFSKTEFFKNCSCNLCQPLSSQTIPLHFVCVVCFSPIRAVFLFCETFILNFYFIWWKWWFPAKWKLNYFEMFCKLKMGGWGIHE